MRLRHFRGVEECELRFPPRGVTVVEGPNEVGKSSLTEAVDLLFDYLDSTTAREVGAVRPVGRDVGSEVEAEVESGPYRFRYFKRFHRDRETRLEVLEPHPERLGGREAHQRVEQILDETLDRALWRALRVVQGEGVAQAELGGAPSLLAALGQAAAPSEGGEGAGRRELALLDRVRQEVLLYFTERRGQPTGPLRQAAEEVEAGRRRLAELEAELAAVEEDAAACATLERRIVELRERSAVAADEAATRLGELREVERLVAEEASARSRLGDEEGRLGLLRELAGAVESEASLAGRLEAVSAELDAAATDLGRVQEQSGEGLAARQSAEEAVAARRREVELAERRERLEALRSDRDRARRAAETAASLGAKVAEMRVTEEVVRRLEERHLAVERVSAAVAAASAGVALRALADLDLEVAGEVVHLGGGESLERRVSEPLRLVLRGVAEVTVAPGGDLEQLAGRLEAARTELAEGLAEVGAADLEEARRALAARRTAEAEIERADAVRAEALRGVAPEELDRRIHELEEELAAGGEGLEEVGDAVAAREALVAAEGDLTRLRVEAAAGEAELASSRQAWEEVRERRRSLDVELRAAAARRERAREGIGRLAAAVGEVEEGRTARGEEAAAAEVALFRDDLAEGAEGELAAALAAAERTAGEARRELAATRTKLAAARPDEVRQEARRAQDDAAELERRLRDSEGELREVGGRLQARGELGLFERAEEARSALAAAERRRASVASRAAAARRLFDALSRARERAREAYSEPLKRKIEELGRPLFGPDFEVELDDELRIARRTSGGISLGFEQLSTGAREQLALLGRVACALLVEPRGGVPLLIDDALGYSDAERLRAMGGILAVAGERCQVIVLTSFPDRYRHVPEATVLALRPRSPESSTDPSDG